MNKNSNFNIPNNANNANSADAYEANAVNKSRVARNVALGAAVLGGGGLAGAAVVGEFGGNGATEQAPEIVEEQLTVDDLAQGAEVSEKPAEVTETKEVHVEKVAPAQPESNDPNIVWDERHEVWIDDERVMTSETGRLDGHRFEITDIDGDNVADIFAYDANNNGRYDSDEMMWLSDEDRIHMGNPVAQTTIDHHNIIEVDPFGPGYAYNDGGQIHNDFVDEKTGESYHGDFADNNPDYNNQAGMNFSDDDMLLADNSSDDRYESYQENSENDFLAEADTTDDFDTMMGGEEFLG